MTDENKADSEIEPTPPARPVSGRGNSEYTPEDLQHLSDIEHVRKRPAMYIGDVTSRGVHHLVYEVVDNSIDEAMADYAKKIRVTVNSDGSVTVEDDGRGIPVEPHEQLSQELGREVSTLEGVMTVLKFGGKFEKGAYQTSAGCMAWALLSSISCRNGAKWKYSETGMSTSRNMSTVFRSVRCRR